MTGFLDQIKMHFESFSSREQWLLGVAGWPFILCVGFSFFLFPQIEMLGQFNAQKNENKRALEEVLLLNIQKEKILNGSADIGLEEELAKQMKDVKDLENLLGSKVNGLVSPSDMPALMEKVLKGSGRLKLLTMQSQPPIQLASTEDKRYYIHPVLLTLTGAYFDIVHYLTALEALPVKYYWQSVDYRVLRYPLAEVKINVYTLGESPVFIGGVREVRN